MSDELTCDKLFKKFSLYSGVSEFSSEYSQSFLLSLDLIRFSDDLFSSITFGTVDSKSFFSTDLTYLYDINELYSLLFGGMLYHHHERLNMGLKLGAKYNYSDDVSFKIENQMFGPIFSSHDYGLVFGVEFKI
ncbi:hypothetical protein [Photobacterium damselae]|uniref:hypothetical protein n=1 Tax=Photobacterium damselae TaxID=38293 RepID=UPI004067C2EF